MAWLHYEGGRAPITTGPAEAVNQVKTVMASLAGQVASFTEKSNEVFDALRSIELQPVGELPPLDISRSDVAFTWSTTPLNGVDLGDLSVDVPPAPALNPIDTSYSFTTPVFSPSVVGIHIPDAPASIDLAGLPERPDIDTDVPLPDAPLLSMPVLDNLTDIVIPAYTFPTFGTFDEAAPTFDEAAPNVLVNWSEPAYMSENFDQVKAVIKRIFAGGTGLPPVIEQQMFDRARAREDQTSAKAVAEAFDTFASKGFTMPPGMLVEQVNAAREQSRLATNTLQRDILIKVADTEIENMRFAVQQGLAAENIIFNIFNNAAQRTFEIAKYTVEASLQLYATKVSLFNAMTSAYSTRAQVFKIQLDAQLASLETYKAQLEGQKVISEINQQRVATFNSRVEALRTQVELYKVTMEGAQIRTEAVRTRIEGYKTDVQAYAERIGAQKTVFDAYRTQVEGEVAKVGIIDAEARVFATLMGAEETKANVRVKGIEAEIGVMQAATQRYAVQLDQAKTLLEGKVARVEAQARVAGLGIQYLGVQSDANRARAEAEIRIGEQKLQSNIAVAQAQIKRYEIVLNRALQEAQLKASSLQAAGQMASTLAGGAMAAQHVQASISSSASDGTSVSFQQGQSAQETWNYQSTSTGS